MNVLNSSGYDNANGNGNPCGDSRTSNTNSNSNSNSNSNTSIECTETAEQKLERQLLAGVSPRSVQITFSTSKSHSDSHDHSDFHDSVTQYSQNNELHHNTDTNNNTNSNTDTNQQQQDVMKRKGEHNSLPFLPLGSQEIEVSTNKISKIAYNSQTYFHQKQEIDRGFNESDNEEEDDVHDIDDIDDDMLPFRSSSFGNHEDAIAAFNSLSGSALAPQVSATQFGNDTATIATTTQMQNSQFSSSLSSHNHNANIPNTSTSASTSASASASKSLLTNSNTNVIHHSQLVGEESMPPFAFNLAKSDLEGEGGDIIGGRKIDLSNSNPIDQNSSSILFDSHGMKLGLDPTMSTSASASASASLGYSNITGNFQCSQTSTIGPLSMSTSHSHHPNNNPEESINFSKLMRQADINLSTQGSISFHDTNMSIHETNNNYNINHNNNNNHLAKEKFEKQNNRKNVSFNLKENIQNNKRHGHGHGHEHGHNNIISPPAPAPVTTSLSQSLSQSVLNRRRAIALNKMTSDSFQLSVQLSPKVSVQDVVDVIANPDMLRFWCEPISALVVTDHKGGSSASMSPPSSVHDSRKQYGQDYQEFVYPDVEEFDDDVIVPPAEDMTKTKKECKVSQQREQHDGEWIKASTPEIILPYMHKTFIDDVVTKVSTFLGFPAYGDVTMFIERNSAQVGFTLGPFKAGTMLSHKIVVTEGDNGQGVILMDEVTILTQDEEDDDGWLVCSCFESMIDITRQWYKASLDGYVDQTKTSLRNLVDLVEGGGELSAYNSKFRNIGTYSGEGISFSDGNNVASQKVPLLV